MSRVFHPCKLVPQIRASHFQSFPAGHSLGISGLFHHALLRVCLCMMTYIVCVALQSACVSRSGILPMNYKQAIILCHCSVLVAFDNLQYTNVMMMVMMNWRKAVRRGRPAHTTYIQSHTVFICQQSYLLLFGIPSPAHSFFPGFKPSFSANPSHGSPSFLLLKYLLRGFPGLFTVISEHICFLLLVFFCFYTF